MAGTIIYCFSGSGNSLAVAGDLALNLDADLRRIAGQDAAEVVGAGLPVGFDTVGFVFPLYDFKAPAIIDELVSGLDLSGCYVFAAATCGVSPGGGLKKFAATLAGKGVRLSAGFSVLMPHNAVGSMKMGDDDQVLFDAWRIRRDEVVDIIRRREERPPDSELLLRAFLTPRILRTIPAVLQLLALLIFKGADSLKFASEDSCTGCGTCRRVCPRDNISLADGRPTWGGNCLGCSACLHWCPEGAINYSGRDLYTRRYRHPEVSLKDMLLR